MYKTFYTYCAVLYVKYEWREILIWLIFMDCKKKAFKVVNLDMLLTKLQND